MSSSAMTPFRSGWVNPGGTRTHRSDTADFINLGVYPSPRIILTAAARAGVLPIEAAKVLVAMLDDYS